jgi:hypothetical protein
MRPYFQKAGREGGKEKGRAGEKEGGRDKYYIISLIFGI